MGRQLESGEVKTLEEFDPVKDKGYLCGHGDAGSQFCSNNAGERLNFKEIADQFVEHKLPFAAREWRPFACYARDKSRPDDFNEGSRNFPLDTFAPSDIYSQHCIRRDFIIQ